MGLRRRAHTRLPVRPWASANEVLDALAYQAGEVADRLIAAELERQRRLGAAEGWLLFGPGRGRLADATGPASDLRQLLAISVAGQGGRSHAASCLLVRRARAHQAEHLRLLEAARSEPGGPAWTAIAATYRLDHAAVRIDHLAIEARRLEQDLACPPVADAATVEIRAQVGQEAQTLRDLVEAHLARERRRGRHTDAAAVSAEARRRGIVLADPSGRPEQPDLGVGSLLRGDRRPVDLTQ